MLARELRLPEAQLLPPALRERCRDALRADASGTAGQAARPTARLQQSVGRALGRLGLSPAAEHALAEGYSVDYALVDERIAIEVDGPSHFARSGDGAGRRPTGKTAIKRRQLAALGFKMPETVKWNADIAHKFYRHGVVLKQVANFYNTIEKQIVRSQKPLLLDHALQFEKLATNPTAKTSGDRGGTTAVRAAARIEGAARRVGVRWATHLEREVVLVDLHELAGELQREARRLVAQIGLDDLQSMAAW